MRHDAWFFVGIFAFIFLIWIAAGGPSRPLSFAGPGLAEPGVLGGGSYLSLPRAPFGIGNSNVSLSGGSDGSTSGGATNLSGVSFGTPSRYRGKIHLSGYVNNPGGDPKNERLTISADQDMSGPVAISGWSLQSEASGSAQPIPQGTEVPSSGIINPIQPIILKPGDQAVVISGSSPIGASFRENKCSGYFASFQNFTPALPNSCPTPSSELRSLYGPDYIRDPACIEYVDRLSRCQVVLTPPTTVGSACQNFLTKNLNYNGCVSAHQNDTDFKSGTWRVYLGRTTALWRTRHEVVKLIDADGNTVDAFTY